MPASGNQTTIQNAVNAASGTTTLVFPAGTYTLTGAVKMASNITLMGTSTPGAPGTPSTIFNVPYNLLGTFSISGLSHVSFCGIHFASNNVEANNNPPNYAVIYVVGSDHISVTRSVFTNTNVDVRIYTTSDFYYQGNKSDGGSGNNNGEPIALQNTDNGNYANVFITDNSFNGCDRSCMEIGFGTGIVTNWHVDRNTITNGNGPSGAAPPISWVDVVNASSANNTVYGNNVTVVAGAFGTGIEIQGVKTVQSNTISQGNYGITISCVSNSAILSNTFTSNANPFGQDGGYCHGEWIGTNTINGSLQTGWSGQTYGAQPVVYSPSAQFQ